MNHKLFGKKKQLNKQQRIVCRNSDHFVYKGKFLTGILEEGECFT